MCPPGSPPAPPPPPSYSGQWPPYLQEGRTRSNPDETGSPKRSLSGPRVGRYRPGGEGRPNLGNGEYSSTMDRVSRSSKYMPPSLDPTTAPRSLKRTCPSFHLVRRPCSGPWRRLTSTTNPRSALADGG